MSRWFLNHVGLARPYRFERTLVLLSVLLLAVMAGAALVHYRLAGELTKGTPRFWYFLYLAVLLGLGVGSNALERYGYAQDDLLPENEPSQAPRIWHAFRPARTGTLTGGAARRDRHCALRRVSAINRQRDIKTVWIGEVVNLTTLRAEGPKAEPWTPYLPEAGWLLLSGLNDVLKREAVALGDVFIDTPVDDFTDGDHFSAAGSQKFAALVAPKIAQACRRS